MDGNKRVVLMQRRNVVLRQVVRNLISINHTLGLIEKIETGAREKIEAINSRTTLRVSKLTDRLREKAKPVLHYFLRNRETLTEGGVKKTAHIEGGEFMWFEGAWSIKVHNLDAAISWLEKHQKEEALRRSVELNKTFLLANPDLVAKVPGLERVQNPLHILRFPDVRTKIEHDPQSGIITIVTPKKKK